MAQQDLVPFGAALERLTMSAPTLTALITAGELPCIRVRPRGKRWIPVQALEAWVANHAANPMVK